MKYLLAGTLLTLSSAAIAEGKITAPTCKATDDRMICELIQFDVAEKFKPSRYNYFGRYRSFLAMAAEKRRLTQPTYWHRYDDNSAASYGEGQVWLSLPKNLQGEALLVPPSQIRKWLVSKAEPSDLALINSEIKAFNELEPLAKYLWMTMEPSKRIEGINMEAKERNNFVLKHRDHYSYDPYKENMDIWLESWKIPLTNKAP
ncbi:hypothetical protein [Neptuniibacter sp. QD37_11]|uniref:hypothetical protein n=1 Tax=Neptuniibacter sp. QD37_11 TaxID=3398209 RepID=UPI0039F49C21